MVEYTKNPAGRCGWIVQVNYKKGGGINPTNPRYFATEAEANKWIADQKAEWWSINSQPMNRH